MNQRCELSSNEQEITLSDGHAMERTGEPLLNLNKVTKHFAGLAAVQDVDLEVHPQEIISIIGPNGAGKTTVFNLITGIYRASSGDVTLAGRSLVGLKPDQAQGIPLESRVQSAGGSLMRISFMISCAPSAPPRSSGSRSRRRCSSYSRGRTGPGHPDCR